MSRDFNPVGIHITAGLGQCANQCLHCQLSSKSLAEFSLDRYVSMVDKFINFRATTGFPVSQWLGYALNFQVDDFANFLGLHRRLVSVVMKILLLGGLPLMDNDQLSGWLSERMALGSESVMASYFGPPQIHDYMNNKNGHFDWEISAQQLAAQIGLINWQKIFLLKTSLPDMDHILDRLDEVDNVAGRMAYLLFYSGLGRRFEEHRLTKEILDSQPQRLKSLYRVEKNMIWQSEGDWLEWVRLNLNSCSEDRLNLVLTDKNIDCLEKMSCEEIIYELTVRTKEAYRMVPGLDELAEKYGDRNSDKVYMYMWEVECLWMDRFLTANPDIKFDHFLTHFAFRC